MSDTARSRQPYAIPVESWAEVAGTERAVYKENKGLEIAAVCHMTISATTT
jgi:hypothetical protein